MVTGEAHDELVARKVSYTIFPDKGLDNEQNIKPKWSLNILLLHHFTFDSYNVGEQLFTLKNMHQLNLNWNQYCLFALDSVVILDCTIYCQIGLSIDTSNFFYHRGNDLLIAIIGLCIRFLFEFKESKRRMNSTNTV